MRAYFVILVAIASVTAADVNNQDENEGVDISDETCAPESYFKEYCNECVCALDGSGSSCTKMDCDYDVYQKNGTFKPPYVCEPYTEFYENRNICVCEGDGLSKSCKKTNSKTHRVVNSAKSGRGLGPVKKCKPGKVFKRYCNQCACAPDGSGLACTKMYCDKRVWNRDGSMKVKASRRANLVEQQRVCEPGKHFKKYCNNCVCSEDGSNYACSRKLCDEDIYNKDGSLKEPLTCEPNTHFMDYCNQCQCEPDGRGAICTAMDCDKDIYNKDGSLKNPVQDDTAVNDEKAKQDWGPLYKQGDSCEPGATFRSQCNQCVCRDDGKSAYCTKRICLTLEIEIDEKDKKFITIN